MEGFKGIEIKRYRGIEKLVIGDFSMVNIFLGQNGSGKSSILEAIMLLTGMSNLKLPQNINNFRTRSFFSNLKDIRYMFHKLLPSNPPSFRALQFDGVQRALQINFSFISKGNDDSSLEQKYYSSSEAKQFFNALEMNFGITELSPDNIKYYKNLLFFDSTGSITDSKYSVDYVEKFKSSFLSPDLYASYLADDLSVLIKLKQKDLIIERLRVFDNRINALESIGDGVYLGFDGINELLPLTMAGDGLRRFLSIVISSANPQNNIILIDEIDNGIHYSAYGKLWKSIFDLAHMTNKQVFVTTHSKETLVQLYNVLKNSVEYQEDFRLYTIEKTLKKGHQAYKYVYEEFEDACRNNVEMRSIVL